MIEMPKLIEFITRILLVCIRFAVVLHTMPIFGERIMPLMLRNSLVIAFLLPFYPYVLPQNIPLFASPLFFLFIALKEAFIGLCISFAVSVIFWAAGNAGHLADMVRGAAFYMMSDQLGDEQATPLSNFLTQVTVIIFFLCGGFRQLVSAILASYRMWPIDQFFPRIDSRTIEFFIEQFGNFVVLTAVIAAPIVVAAFVADYALGLTNRFAPQMNIFMISMPVKSAICTITLLLYVTFAAEFLRNHIMSGDAILALVKGAIE